MTFSDDIAAFWDSFLMHRLHKLLNLKRRVVKLDDDDDDNDDDDDDDDDDDVTIFLTFS